MKKINHLPSLSSQLFIVYLHSIIDYKAKAKPKLKKA